MVSVVSCGRIVDLVMASRNLLGICPCRERAGDRSSSWMVLPTDTSGITRRIAQGR